MFRPISPKSNESYLFYVEQSSNELSSPRPNTPIVVSSRDMSGKIIRELIHITSIASRGPQVVTIDSHSSELSMPYGFGRHVPIFPLGLKNLNLLRNSFNIKAIMAVANPTAEGHDINYCPQSPEPSEPSPISTPPMNLSTIEGWETPHTTMDDNTLYSDDEPRRIYFLLWSLSPPLPLRNFERKLSLGMSFPKTEECRSTSSRFVDSHSLSRGTNQARR